MYFLYHYRPLASTIRSVGSGVTHLKQNGELFEDGQKRLRLA